MYRVEVGRCWKCSWDFKSFVLSVLIKISIVRTRCRRLKPGSHWRHKHNDKINTKTKHDISSGTCEDKTTRLFLCFVFCWVLSLCMDYDLMLMLKLPISSKVGDCRDWSQRIPTFRAKALSTTKSFCSKSWNSLSHQPLNFLPLLTLFTLYPIFNPKVFALLSILESIYLFKARFKFKNLEYEKLNESSSAVLNLFITASDRFYKE